MALGRTVVSDAVVVALVLGAILAVVALIGYLAYLLVFFKLAKDGKPSSGIVGPDRVFRRGRGKAR